VEKEIFGLARENKYGPVRSTIHYGHNRSGPETINEKDRRRGFDSQWKERSAGAARAVRLFLADPSIHMWD